MDPPDRKLVNPTSVFVFNRGGMYPPRAPDKGVRPNPFVLAWVTNVSTSPDLIIEFSTDSTRTDPRLVYEATNSSRSPGEPQRKRKPRSAISLFKLLAS